jgi:flagellin
VAIDYIANARAQMAAQQNRLDATSSGLLTYQDNLTTAESQIADVDMALETTKYSTYEVLTNAANAMLAQANGLSQNVLQLLQ